MQQQAALTTDGADVARLVTELQAFFQAVQRGAPQSDFAYTMRSDAEEEIVELTYRPTGVVRWYDARVLRWSLHAVADFNAGQFAR
jgi:hypothetical protein